MVVIEEEVEKMSSSPRIPTRGRRGGRRGKVGGRGGGGEMVMICCMVMIEEEVEEVKEKVVKCDEMVTIRGVMYDERACYWVS